MKPLLTLDKAASLLGGIDLRTVLAMVDEGRLGAVDIAACGERRCLRLYSTTLCGQAIPEPEEILPARPCLRIHDITRLLVCSTQHVRNLDLPILEPAPRSQRRYLTSGLAHFLRSRTLNPELAPS